MYGRCAIIGATAGSAPPNRCWMKLLDSRAAAEGAVHSSGESARAVSLGERDARVIANIARLRFSPLSLVGGCGSRLIEEGGRQLLDLSASFGPAALGYSHPAITRAVTAACANMAGASLLAYPNENA